MIIRKRRKGQYLVIQEVLVYGVGLFLLIGVLATFTYVKNTIYGSVRESELRVVGDLVSSSIQGVKNTVPGTQIIIEIPRDLAGVGYTVTTNLIGTVRLLSVTDGQTTYTTQLDTIVDDAVIRGSEKVIVSRKANSIGIRGV